MVQKMGAGQSHKPNLYRVLFRLLDISDFHSTLARTLDPLARAIREASSNTREARRTKDQEFIDVIVDDECEVVESLLGSAFVVCQVYMTRVVSITKALHRIFNGDQGRRLRTSDGSKSGILEVGSQYVGSSAYRDVQIIDALANYFKHRDECSVDWRDIPVKAQDTATIIRAVGCTPGSTANLRTGAEALGNNDYESMSVFATRLENWRNNLSDLYETELKSEGLL